MNEYQSPNAATWLRVARLLYGLYGIGPENTKRRADAMAKLVRFLHNDGNSTAWIEREMEFLADCFASVALEDFTTKAQVH